MATNAQAELGPDEATDLAWRVPPAVDVSDFEKLLRQHERQLRQFAFRLLGSPERMEDALQEAFLHAYEALPGFRPRGEEALRVWLFRILYHTCIDQIRRDERRERRERREPDDLERISVVPNLDAGVAARSALAGALAALPLDLRAAVLIVDLFGFSYADAAGLLEIPNGTLGSRLNRGRKALRTSLRPFRAEEGR